MKKILTKLIELGILNNSVFNKLLLFFKLDNRFALYTGAYNYKNEHNPDGSKSLQEIAGYSERPEIKELLDFIHAKLKSVVSDNLNKDDRILDIGCGPGLFLQSIGTNYQLEGIDITPGMIELAQKEIPEGKFYLGDFVSQSFEGKFNFIFSVGTLMYIGRTDIKRFKIKIDRILETNGYVFISYPHAISKKDLGYPDLFYVQYSPEYLEELFGTDYNVEYHARAVDEKTFKDFDHEPFIHPDNPAYKTYKNSSIIILSKK
ncbi:MAG: class I SAM-dependent methyltransferase [Crocinitomicaceae bacterium]|nr:class I SAM-dependent methyltransferase [Crocinitomicaceae bacterium]